MKAARPTSLRDARLVAVGSMNPVKLAAARAVIGPLAPAAEFRGIDVPSGVRAQPWGDQETRRGALNRARAAREALDADFGVGFEGGVTETADGELRTCAWAAVIDAAGITSIGGSLALPLPSAVSELVADGMELGDAMDRLLRQRGTKQGAGAVGVLTAGLIDRQRAYEPMLVYALTRWVAPEWWG
ncbi:MAG TPA: inosine/xanthosine triphosphatase [Gemmatimonadaceae bacterium]|nr:inosine/xanthosine triphosphatase [Gemmatimonadaceae bacterium]